MNTYEDPEIDLEVLGGLIIAVTLASHRKVTAGLRHAASGQYQDYPEGVLELGVALDALGMMLLDIVDCIVENTTEAELCKGK